MPQSVSPVPRSATGRDRGLGAAHSTPRNGNAAPSHRSVRRDFVVAQPFSIDDAQMRLEMGRLVVNGKSQFGTEGARVVTGALVWFDVPGHGRYIFSLIPRPDLGFERAGEVRGRLVTFSVDNDHVVLESPAMVAPGETPYFLDVVHDSSWAPTVQVRGGQLVFGLGLSASSRGPHEARAEILGICRRWFRGRS